MINIVGCRTGHLSHRSVGCVENYDAVLCVASLVRVAQPSRSINSTGVNTQAHGIMAYNRCKLIDTLCYHGVQVLQALRHPIESHRVTVCEAASAIDNMFNPCLYA
jgi:hypothetical protein